MLKTGIVLVVFCACTVLGFTQDATFEVHVTNRSDDSKISGATVSVYKTSIVIEEEVFSSITDSLGKVTFSLEAGMEYRVLVENGNLVPRFFTIDLKGLTDELMQGTGTVQGGCVVSLFPEVEGGDYSYITSHPITKFYVGSSFKLLYDSEMAAKMAAEIKRIDSSR